MEGFRSLNRSLRDHDGDLSVLPPRDRLRAEGLDAALQKAPIAGKASGRLPRTAA